MSQHMSASNLITNYLLKFLKYILPSSKDWTGVGLLSDRDVYLRSTSVSRKNVLSIELVLKSDTSTMKTYYKSATSDENIMGIFKETRPRLLNLLIVSDGQQHHL